MIQSVEADQNTLPLTYPALIMLQQFADNSLLVRLPIMGEHVYFTVLYTLREYMLEKLSTQGMYEWLKDWHAYYYLGVVEDAEIGMRGPKQLQWLERLRANQDNIRAALEWSLQRAKTETTIHSSSSEPGSIEAIDDEVKTDWLLSRVVPVKELSSAELVSQTCDVWLQGQLLFHLAAAVGFISDFKQMRAYYTQSRELFEQIGDTIAIADLLKDQGGLTILEGNYSEAIDYLVRSIKMCSKLGHKQFIATGLGSLSFAVGLRGEPEPGLASIYSAKLGGATEGLMEAIGLIPWTKTSKLAQMARQFIRSR